ncbi:MAG: SEC-C domain-containing protein [Sedimenticola sp.]
MKTELQRQIAELHGTHKGLAVIAECGDEVIISGSLPFEASVDGLDTISDTFDIELTIPTGFPDHLPWARETSGRIESVYGHLNSDGTLCLAVPVEQRRIFLMQPSLLGFVNRLVIPYLYGYCFWKKYGRHPFGEADHGYEGILRHYMDTLSLSNEVKALSVIAFLFEHGYRGHHECPCGSGKKVRACHGPILLSLHQTHSTETLEADFVAIFKWCIAKVEAEEMSLPDELRRQVLRILKRHKSS